MDRNVVIIGYGTAAANAAIALRSAGYEGKVTVLSSNGTIPYSPILTSYYAGGTKTYEQVFPWSEAELATLGMEVLQNCPALQLNTAEHTVSTPQGPVPYTKCLIASGASPITGGFPQIEGYQPLVLRTLDNGEVLKTALEDPACQRVLVSGTSMVAMKMVEACLDRGKSVTVLGRSPHILRRTAAPATAQLLEDFLASKGVQLRLGQTATGGAAADDGVTVSFSDDTQDAFDCILVAHGVKANLDFVAEGALSMEMGGLATDQFLRTSDPDVYAAGDVACVTDLVSGQRRILGLWHDACEQGAAAGRAIAADLAGTSCQPYRGGFISNTLIVQEAVLISAGLTKEGDGVECSEPATANGATKVLFTKEGKLVGFNVFSGNSAPGSSAYDMAMELQRRL